MSIDQHLLSLKWASVAITLIVVSCTPAIDKKVVVSVSDYTGRVDLQGASCEVKSISGDSCMLDCSRKKDLILCSCEDAAFFDDSVEASIQVSLGEEATGIALGRGVLQQRVLKFSAIIANGDDGPTGSRWSRMDISHFSGHSGDSIAFAVMQVD